MKKLPVFVRPLVLLAGWSGFCQGVLWIVLGILSVLSYSTCLFNISEPSPSELFGVLLQRQYFLSETCENVTSVGYPIMSSYQVFTWACIYIGLTLIWMFTSINIIIFVTDANLYRANISLYAWSLATLGVSAVDIAVACFFGIDYTEIGTLMDSLEQDSLEMYSMDLLRGGALLLMFVALRGVLLLVYNLVMLILLFYYTMEINKEIDRSQHPIHTVGTVHAFDKTNQSLSDPWIITNPDILTVNPFLQAAEVARRRPVQDRDYEQDSPSRAKETSAVDPWNVLITERLTNNPLHQAAAIARKRQMQEKDYDDGNSPIRTGGFEYRSNSWHHSRGQQQNPTVPASSSRHLPPLAIREFVPLSNPSSSPDYQQRPSKLSAARDLPPRNVMPIPTPDYSPPMSRLKPVLKPKY